MSHTIPESNAEISSVKGIAKKAAHISGINTHCKNFTIYIKHAKLIKMTARKAVFR